MFVIMYDLFNVDYNCSGYKSSSDRIVGEYWIAKDVWIKCRGKIFGICLDIKANYVQNP
jgi:hypothetical protein